MCIENKLTRRQIRKEMTSMGQILLEAAYKWATKFKLHPYHHL
jgi:hypothetical protein